MNVRWKALLVAGGAAGVFYQARVRPRFRAWGTAGAERSDAYPGDDFVPNPNYQATLATDIAASPEHVWPWLVQMGDGRGGLYSYDFLDRLFGFIHGPSRWEVLPDYQKLVPGERIPLGRGEDFPVVAVEEGRFLVLGATPKGFTWSWTFAIQPTAEGSRLISRSRAKTAPGLSWTMGLLVLEPAAFLMTRRMLIGIKQRAERLAASSTDAPAPREMAYSEA
jgi:hypothetical protein